MVIKPDFAFVLGHLLAIAGCRGDPTFIADEIEEEGSETQPMACEGLTAAPGDTERTIEVDGYDRSYWLHIPDSYTGEAPVPLLFDFHASRGSGESQLATSIYPRVTDADGVITAFPDGWEGSRGTGWNIGPCCVEDVDDVAFTMAMIEDIETVACIDSSRIYAAGLYTGGGMAYYLACHAADVFAAVASSAFDLDEVNAEDCAPSRPISVISFRTQDDPVMDWEGGPGNLYPDSPLTFLGAEGTFEKWAEINGCTGEASDTGNGCEEFTDTQCDGDAEVMFCTDEQQSLYGDADIAWSVLQRHTLP